MSFFKRKQSSIEIILPVYAVDRGDVERLSKKYKLVGDKIVVVNFLNTSFISPSYLNDLITEIHRLNPNSVKAIHCSEKLRDIFNSTAHMEDY